MKRHDFIREALRLFCLSFALGFCISANAQNYPGAGSSRSGNNGIIYLPNGMPFQVGTGTSFPGGLYFPNNPGFYTPPTSTRTSIQYSPYYRSRNRAGVSSLIDSQNAKQTKTKTTWEAPTAVDEKIDLEIESTQVDHGVDSREAMNLIWTRAKQYYEGHYYEQALKMLDQLEPLRRKKDKLSLISDASIDKMRRDIDLKLGKNSFSSLRQRSRYFSNGNSSRNTPISLDSFLDPSRTQNNYFPQRGRNFYP